MIKITVPNGITLTGERIVSAKVAITAKDVIKAFGLGETAVRALDQVSVDIESGEFFTLLGPSGCGKTTLLRLIAGFEMPSAGQILIDGKDVTGAPPNQRAVNTVFQSYALFPHLTVAENIGFGLKMQGKSKAVINARVAQMLALVKLEAMAGRKTSQLSGGQQQRVALARALAPEPKVLLLDEPLSALDLKLRKEMQIELKRLQRETGITFVFVTHDQEEALTMSDRIAVMSAGKIQQIGGPRDIYTRPVNRFVASFIGETNFIPATPVPGGARLDNGLVLAAEGEGSLLIIRPEHLRLMPEGAAGTVPARVESLVYFGTDTNVHLRLHDGTLLVARVPSPADGHAEHLAGDMLGLGFAPGAARLIRE